MDDKPKHKEKIDTILQHPAQFRIDKQAKGVKKNIQKGIQNISTAQPDSKIKTEGR